MLSQSEQIEEHFHRAVGLKGPELEEYLANECEAAGLRQQVASLIEFHHQGSAVVDQVVSHAEAPPSGLTSGVSLAGRFQVVRQIGSGGMGEVYEAIDLELGARVAVKTLRPELTYDATNRARFKTEILNGRKASHPNLCAIYDLIHDPADKAGPLAFAMELIEGETLSAHLHRQPERRLSPEAALLLVRQMAAGLEALHRDGIVHRDFKPSNVLLADREGGSLPEVKITDFGLARRDGLGAPDGLTLSGSRELVGTPSYMAPEQLRAQRDLISARTDVYALGLVIYEMVTGVRPFEAETLADNIVQKLDGTFAAPKEHVPDLNETWNATIIRCLDKEPENRPASPGIVVAALEGATELPTLVIQPGATGRRRFWSKGRLLAAKIAAAVVLFAVVARFMPDLRQRMIGAEQQLHVAVLRFDTIGGDEELQALADGLMRTITKRLSQYEGVNQKLLVMAASTVIQRAVRDAEDAAHKLGANYAVAGDLQAQGDVLRLTLALVNATEGHQVGSVEVRGSRSNTLGLQDAAARSLANLMNLRIQPEQLDSESAASQAVLGADQFYQTGVGYLARSNDTQSIDRAILQFRRAIEEDEGFALAHAGLCEANFRMFERRSDRTLLEEAAESCETAEALNDQLPEIQIGLGNVNFATGNHEEALENFQQALELEEKNAEALLGLAKVYAETGKRDEALATYDQAIRRRPADWRMYQQAGRFHFREQNHAAAIEAFERYLDLTPDSAQAHQNLGAALARSGRLEEAIARFEQAIQIEPRSEALAGLAKIALDRGEYAEAARHYGRAVELKGSDYALRGELAAAFDYLSDQRAGDSYRKAAALAEEALQLNDKRIDLYSLIAHYRAGGGQSDQAGNWLEKALGLGEAAGARAMFRNAATLSRLGHIDEAFDWLASALQAGYDRADLKKQLETSTNLRK